MEPGMVKDLAQGAIPPLLIALVFFAVAWRRHPGKSGVEAPAARADWRAVVTPLVFAATFILTYAFLFGFPPMLPVLSQDWLPFVALAAGVAGALVAIESLPAILRWLAVGAAMAFGGWASFRNLAARVTGPEVARDHLAMFALTGIVALGAVHVLTGRRTGVFPVILLLIFAGGASQLLVLGHFSKNTGQIVGMNAAMLLAAFLVSLWRPGLALGAGGVSFIVTTTMVALFQGRLYGSAAPEAARFYLASLVLSPVLAALTLRTFAPRDQNPRLGWVRALAVLLVATVPIAYSFAFAARQWIAEQRSDSSSSSDDPYEGLPI